MFQKILEKFKIKLKVLLHKKMTFPIKGFCQCSASHTVLIENL